jgi:hypothetical protein
MLAVMARRILITFDDDDVTLLREVSRRSGESMAALVRRAVRSEYGRPPTKEERLAALEIGFGAWANRPPDAPDPHEDLRRLRGPGMGPGRG